jgi:hypothetical protein
MLPVFVTPWALAGLLALPALAAIYYLRSRFRRQPVSSLMLWQHQREAREGGLRVQRLQTPLVFFLELAALLLLTLAAAGPENLAATGGRPLVVILDDSFSMQAGGDDSARNRATAAVRDEVRAAGGPVRFVLAGEAPQVLGEAVRGAAEAQAVLEGWRCRAPAASLAEAIGLAVELGGPGSVLLVVSDYAPDFDLEKGRVRWRAFGEPRPNVAFVNAARTASDAGHRLLLEVANLAPAARTTPLVVETAAGTALHRAELVLSPWESRRVVLKLADDTPAVRARLGDDALDIDNRVTLLAEPAPPVRVEVAVGDDKLRRLWDNALKATRRVVLTGVRPDLRITDQAEDAGPAGETWTVHVLAEKEAEGYVGPFVLNHNHPLTEGLSLAGVVWGAGKEKAVPGAPVILAGNVPLLTDVESATGRHDLRLRLRPDLSTVQDSPQWPILVWNLVQWRASQMPGLRRVNLRLGELAALRVGTVAETVTLTPPDGKPRPVTVRDREAFVRAEVVGLYELREGDVRHAFAVNALRREESDLSGCTSGEWGEWADERGHGLEGRSFAWILVLLATLALTAHLMLIGRKTGATG